MVKIKFYRRLQKELSTDIGIISGNILGENFILEYGLAITSHFLILHNPNGQED